MQHFESQKTIMWLVSDGCVLSYDSWR